MRDGRDVAAANLKVVTPATAEIGAARHSCPNGDITMRYLTEAGTSGSRKALKCKENI